jgi:hypothetical protein
MCADKHKMRKWLYSFNVFNRYKKLPKHVISAKLANKTTMKEKNKSKNRKNEPTCRLYGLRGSCAV